MGMWQVWVCGGYGYVVGMGMWRVWVCGGYGYVAGMGMWRVWVFAGYKWLYLDPDPCCEPMQYPWVYPYLCNSLISGVRVKLTAVLQGLISSKVELVQGV